ncbi:serine hydrolase [Rhodoferax koreense]|uniref:beta-lactamase n=1 Tax=Rhodoferax koreensis TaxID=1842727 RepID=A0A1P8JQ86_9BURK|nr:serine hydrolase [Rhodoferax koreense]APW35901.1 serine hydrolase [Rhodoferax koreense]
MNPFVSPRPASCLALLLTSLAWLAPAHAADWSDALKARVAQIDQATPGQLGVYVKRLDNGETMRFEADRPWYLASSAKLPVAIALLQEVEKNKIKLSDKLVLKETDKVDGSGAVVWQKNGTSYTVDSLLKRMLMDSDNTAANMLIRTIGEDTLNDYARDYLGRKGFEKITDFTAVRYDVYAEIHTDARKLSNMDLVRAAAAPLGPKRFDTLVRTMGVDKAAVRVKTIDEAYARYYAKGANTATLEGYGGMLEQLVRGKLLSAEHMKLLYTDLKFDTYDAYRLEAGLPRTVKFIHKTGTQMHRACHMGVIDPQDGGRAAIVVATCAEGLDEHAEAGRAFEQIGRAITQTMLTER